ncbi:MAG TPA: Rieske 2Fe-2S domain-containing protein [Gemmatimonadales bacterium]|nr:Rieske 2Fe-2S domain-containing protein [Gemmatimonadales bacterium]
MRLLHALERHNTRISYPIPAADSVSIDTENQVILVRWDAKVYAFNLSCPHQNTALRWQEDEKRFQCPKHKSRYQPDGTFISGRATRGMYRLAIHREGAGVRVDIDTMYKQDEDRAGWEDAVVTLSTG